MELALEKRKERAKLTANERAIVEKAKAEKRGLNADEKSTLENIDKRHAELESEIKALEADAALIKDREAALEKREQELRTPIHEIAHRAAQPSSKPVDAREAAQMNEFRAALQGQGATKFQFRAHQLDNQAAGGYLAKPAQFVNELITTVDNMVFMRQICRNFTLTEATPLRAPSRDTRLSVADWTQEITAVTEDTSMTFGKRDLKPHPLSKLVKMSNTLLRLAAISPEALLREELAYTFAVTMETAFMSGSGAGQPLGIFTASNDGVPTSRDVSTGNTTTAVTADGLWNAFYSLKEQYQKRAVTVGHRDFAKMVRKLKLGTGEYIWSPGINSAQPDTMFGRPFYQSEYAPNTFTTGLYVACIFDPNAYWIAQTLNLDIQILRELYAATNQTGFIGRAECDGQPVISEAYVRVALA